MDSETMNDDDAIEGLNRLGLTTYEARVFLGLQKLGRGTASEVSDVADVPRSQVYGAAEGLEERGLLETQQSTPTVYRPVSLEQARRQLLDQLAETGAETFDYLDAIQGSRESQERTESIWMINDRDSVAARTLTLAEQADSRLLYAVDSPGVATDEILAAFAAAADRGVRVVLASADETVLSQADSVDGLSALRVPAGRNIDVDIARLLVADGQTVLLSTRTAGNSGPPATEGRPDAATSASSGQEVAFWTSETAFASVLAELAEAWLEEPFS
jgi:sugar-specific transcriptional regulator TrmB